MRRFARVAAVLVLSLAFLAPAPISAQTMTDAQLRATISQLLTILAQLQAQLAAIQGAEATDTSISSNSTATASARSSFSEAKALAFVSSLYDPSAGLVREYPGSNTYWLWSDNLLAQAALKQSNPRLSSAIRTKMDSYGITMRYAWAVLDPAYAKNASFLGTAEYRVGNSNVRYSNNDAESELSCAQYADIAFLKAIYLYKTGDARGARECYDAGKRTWDGTGMKDGGNITGDYAVYKVALGLLAQKITGFPSIGIPDDYFDRFQAANGGITTDIVNGQPAGLQNVETTAAVLFAKNLSLLDNPRGMISAPVTASATVNSETFSTPRPTITGTASGLSAVTLALTGLGDKFAESVRVVNGRWSYTLPWDIRNGTYGVEIHDGRSEPVSSVLLATGQIVIASGQTSAPVIHSLTASPSSVSSGQPVTLSWSSSQATSCGVLTGNTWVVMNLGTNGSYTVYPNASTLYTLSCAGMATANTTGKDVPGAERTVSVSVSQQTPQAPATNPPAISSGPVTKTYNATSGLQHNFGRADEDGWSAATALDAEGTMLYGPYATDWNGSTAEATFRLMVDNNSADDLRVVTVDIYDSTAGQILAIKDINRRSFNGTFAYQDFTLSASLAGRAGHSIETRVYWHDVSYVRVRQVSVRVSGPVSAAANSNLANALAGLKAALAAFQARDAR